MSSAIPGGLTAKQFKLFSAEISEWMLGTIKGSWNEKMSVSQIIADAVIGMIPIVGDVTAARDLIAVGTGLATSEAKRESTMEWVLLVILIFALIPVLGGVIKGVGRLSLRAAEIAVKDSAAAAKLAEEILAFLNRVGHKNAEKWLKTLDVLKYEGELVSRFRAFCDVIIITIIRYVLRFHSVMPQSMVARLEQLSEGFKKLKTLGDSMIPKALKELNQHLKRIQQYIHAGGPPPPSRAATMTAQTGQKAKSYVEEARLLEKGGKKAIIHAGKYPQNIAGADNAAEIRKVYKAEPGYPNLQNNKISVMVDGVNIDYYPAIAAATGKIQNEMLESVTLFRSFGPKGVTFNVPVDKSNPVGMFWGLGPPPATGPEWRDPFAVLDEWNRNGWLTIVHIPKGVKIPACTSVVSEQFSKAIAGQYLVGGAQQAATTAFFTDEMTRVTQQLVDSNGGKSVLSNGITVEIRQSGWVDVNEVVGYDKEVIPSASMTERLGVTEFQLKAGERAVQAGAKVSARQQTNHEQEAKEK